ncbi:melanocortin-2 receptor accessory protein [Cyrtonyx montezumae]|uniref:melanocortin-2 receptor accessory protein n=1 Tax=Cyrtonyx montezumae TaxID=9017 RepID=UPI0032DB662A
MANRTNSSDYFWSYEYYWDYIDPIPVDGRKLKANKYSIVIAFWVGLAAFVMFLFLILLHMSCSGSNPPRQVVERNEAEEESSSNSEQPHCDNLSNPFPDSVVPGTPICLPDQTGIQESISA